jgi:predicted glycosyltransferase
MREREQTLLLYCQHSFGVGHLRRSWALASSLSNYFRVVVLNGGAPIASLRPPAGIEIVELPPLSQEVEGRLVALDPARSVDETQQRRQEIALEVFHACEPDVLLIELFPFGRRKFEGELRPLLEAARRVPDRIIACSLRDILVGRRDGQTAHDDHARALADTFFDVVLVHADPSFARLEESFHPSVPMHVPVQYTGFVVCDSPPEEAARPREPRVIVSAGGGRYGEPLLSAALGAFAQVRSNALRRMTLVTGPLYPDAAWNRLNEAVRDMEYVTLWRIVPDLHAKLATSMLSVSQCGYNTALDLLRARVPAIVVPFSEAGEDEQMNRARRLERLGVVHLIPGDELTPSRLASAMGAALNSRPVTTTVNTDGARRTAELLTSLVRERRSAASFRQYTC